MIAPNTSREYWTWIARSSKYMPAGIKKIISAGQQITWRYIHSIFQENFLKSFNYLNKSQISIFYNLNRATLSYGLSRIKSSLLNMVSTITFLTIRFTKSYILTPIHDNKRYKAIIFI